MKASEVRKITEEKCGGSLTKPYLDIIYDIIKRKSHNGENYIYNPFYYCNRLPTPSNSLIGLIFADLRNNGFKVSFGLPGYEAAIEW